MPSFDKVVNFPREAYQKKKKKNTQHHQGQVGFPQKPVSTQLLKLTLDASISYKT